MVVTSTGTKDERLFLSGFIKTFAGILKVKPSTHLIGRITQNGSLEGQRSKAYENDNKNSKGSLDGVDLANLDDQDTPPAEDRMVTGLSKIKSRILLTPFVTRVLLLFYEMQPLPGIPWKIYQTSAIETGSTNSKKLEYKVRTVTKIMQFTAQ